ncbi:MAG: hypothetical protein HRU04_24075 [Oceanospirillaceae bacterium]|nr:hypothetical protein [Oceanospirillaceae bacterium]
MKYLILVLLSLFTFGCTQAYQPTNLKKMDIYLGESSHAELVDFLYDYAGKNRLNIQWFGWYKVDNAKSWYERSDEDSSFKIKLELLTKENGSLFLVSRPHQSNKIYLSIDYADEKAEWLNIVEEFKKSVASQGWRIE